MTKLIGRVQELTNLEKALQAARHGNGYCVLLTGEEGIGKSRLIFELKRRAASEKFTILQGNCFKQDVSFPYAPWIDALRSCFAALTVPGIKDLLGSFLPEFLNLLPELALLFPHVQPALSLEPQAEKYRLFESIVRFISSLSSSHPALFVLEDLHWGDALSLELVQYFARRTHDQSVMLVGTFRSEEMSAHLLRLISELNHEHLAEEVRVAPLDQLQVKEFARALSQDISPIMLELPGNLISLSEGNPFFIEEIIKNLVGVGKAGEPPVPNSIRDTVRRRVEQLPERTQQVLSYAAVIGERFDFGLLQEISGQDEKSLLQMMKELIAAQLIVEQSADQFAFRHALTHEAVYTGLMLRERKAIHQTIGEKIERLVGLQTDSSAPELAYHFYNGGNWQKAMKYSQRAGVLAMALYAPAEANTHFTHALEAALQLNTPRSGLLLRNRAQAREILGEFENARVDYEEALHLARREENLADEWQLLIDLGFLWQSRDLVHAGEYYQQALELARSLGDPSILAQTLNRTGNWHLNYGRPQKALPFHREALSLFQAMNDRQGIAHTMDLLAVVSFQFGEVVEGEEYLQQAIPILREMDDRQALVNTLTNLASLAQFETEFLGGMTYQQLADLCQEALQIAEESEWQLGEVRALIPGAICLSYTGDYARALEWLNRAQAITEAFQHRELSVRFQITYGQVLIGLLALPEARDRLEAGLASARELGPGFFTLAAVARLVNVLVLQNDFVRAKEMLDTLLPAEFPDVQQTLPARKLWSARAELELAQGNPGVSLEIVDRLVGSAVSITHGTSITVPYLSHLRSRALMALGRMQEAETELLGTLQVAISYGQRPLLWRLHVDLGRVYRSTGRRAHAGREFSLARTIIQDLTKNIPDSVLRDNFTKRVSVMVPAPPRLTARQIAKQDYSGLTAREREIAALISQGKSNREIADELVISEKTAERHVANILLKLGFKSRTQIGVWATDKGLDK